MICTECLRLIQNLERLERIHDEKMKTVRARPDAAQHQARLDVEAARRELHLHQRSDAVRKMSSGFVQAIAHDLGLNSPLF